MDEELEEKHKKMLGEMVKLIAPTLIQGYRLYGPLLFIGVIDGLNHVMNKIPNPLADIDDVPAKSYLMRALKHELDNLTRNATEEELAGWSKLNKEKPFGNVNH